MAIGLPVIDVTFTKLAATAVSRSQKGTLLIVVNDDTATEKQYEYTYETDVKKSDFTEENYNAICRAFKAMPNKVIVVRAKNKAQLSTVTKVIDTVSFNWCCYINENKVEQDLLVSYIKSRNKATASKKVKAVVFCATTPDDSHIVNFTNTTVTAVGSTKAISGHLYVARIAGILAAIPFTRSCTYYKLSDLKAVAEPEDVNAAIKNGELVIINNYGTPKIARGVNTLTTLSEGVTTEFQKITVVEAMDIILEDIYKTFSDSYVGKYKNKLDNQYLFIAAVNGYFRDLSKEGVLDPEFDNHSEIDTEVQREKWISEGKSEASEWDEEKVKKMTYQTYVFLKGHIKILDAMEDLTFTITIE